MPTECGFALPSRAIEMSPRFGVALKCQDGPAAVEMDRLRFCTVVDFVFDLARQDMASISTNGALRATASLA